MKYAALVKPRTGETYLFLWHRKPESLRTLMQRLGVMAADQELSLNWGDLHKLQDRILKIERITHDTHAS